MSTPLKFATKMTEQIKINLTPDQLKIITLAARQTGQPLVDVWRDAMVSIATVAVTGNPEARIDLTTLQARPVETKPATDEPAK
jgi:uncharacterized protein (DUF1778 family)